MSCMIKRYHDRQESIEDSVPTGAVINVMSKDTVTHIEDTVTDNSVPECIHEDVLSDGNTSFTEFGGVNEVSQGSGIEDLDHEYVVPKLKNSEVLAKFKSKIDYLNLEQQVQLIRLLDEYPTLFSDTPTRTDVIYHDVEVGDAVPIKQHPYRVNPLKSKEMQKEVQYMLDNGIIEPSKSNWSSPCVLVPKSDGTFRFCTDYRRVNAATKSDTYPIPRVDDCIDKVGKAEYVSKFDLLKGYWQIPLTERAKEISAFVTQQGLYQYRVMAFGMKNSSATFQRMINDLISDLDNCDAYIDDLVVYSDTWSDHLEHIRKLFDKLSHAKLTVNLNKSEFAKAQVEFLGHVVGQGKVRPILAKVKDIIRYPAPKSKKELMRFLGMVGYYRRYCPNFAEIVTPLTNLLSKKAKFLWDETCQSSFKKVKQILMSEPVLIAPNFERQFKLNVDASDVAVGGVLFQEDEDGINHPICYFSKKFNKHQRNYSTIEKETLALLLALQHFDVYLNVVKFPILVYTDHDPLRFIHRMKNSNQRLLRWSLSLQEYDLVINHIRGKDNIIADALSRTT